MNNLFSLSEKLKDFSKNQLVQEMQQPSGSVPPFLVMTELQRRTRMEKEAAAGGPDDTTVAQDTVSAAGVPQGGIADMARAMAPKTDVDANDAETPQAPTQRMAEGGQVEGGREVEYQGETYTAFPDGRVTDAQGRDMRDVQPLLALLVQQELRRGDVAGAVSTARDDMFYDQLPGYGQATRVPLESPTPAMEPPQAQDLGPGTAQRVPTQTAMPMPSLVAVDGIPEIMAGERGGSTRSRRDARTLSPQTGVADLLGYPDSGQFPELKAAYEARRMEGAPTEDEPAPAPSAGGLPRLLGRDAGPSAGPQDRVGERMAAPGTVTSGQLPPGAVMSSLAATYPPVQPGFGVMPSGPRPTEPGTSASSVPLPPLPLGPAAFPEGTPAPAMSRSMMPGASHAAGVSGPVRRVDLDRLDDLRDLGEWAAGLRTNIRNLERDYGAPSHHPPSDGEGQEIERYHAGKARDLAYVERRMSDIRSEMRPRDAGIAALQAALPDVERRARLDQTDDARAGRSRATDVPDMDYGPPRRPALASPSGVGTSDTVPSAGSRARREGPVPGTLSFEEMFLTGTPQRDMRRGSSIPQPPPGMTARPDDALAGPELPPQREFDTDPDAVAPGAETRAPTGPQGGGGGGGGGGGMSAGSSSSAAEGGDNADRWLSLARFGLGLMASQAPTLGQAIGEAGGPALDELYATREREREERYREEDMAMQMRLAGMRAAGRGGAPELDREALMEEAGQLRMMLEGMDPEKERDLYLRIGQRLGLLESALFPSAAPGGDLRFSMPPT